MPDQHVIIIESVKQFETDVIQASQNVPVLVDFWASWCQPCQILMPLLTKLAAEYGGNFILAKVNTEEHQDLAMMAGVRNLPTVKLFSNGRIVDQFMGALPESEIRAFLNKHVKSEFDAQIDNALALSGEGKHDAAIDLLKALNKQQPENSKVYLAIAKAYLNAGELDNSEAVLNALSAEIKLTPEYKSLRAEADLAIASQDSPEIDVLLKKIEEKPDDLESRMHLANQYIARRQHEEALQQLIFILSRDMSYNEGGVKQTMLNIFETLGNQGPLVKRYRNRLASLMY